MLKNYFIKLNQQIKKFNKIILQSTSITISILLFNELVMISIQNVLQSIILYTHLIYLLYIILIELFIVLRFKYLTLLLS